MAVEPGNAESWEGFPEVLRERVLKRPVTRLLSRKNGMVNDFETLPSALEQHIQKPLNHVEWSLSSSRKMTVDLDNPLCSL